MFLPGYNDLYQSLVLSRSVEVILAIPPSFGSAWTRRKPTEAILQRHVVDCNAQIAGFCKREAENSKVISDSKRHSSTRSETDRSSFRKLKKRDRSLASQRFPQRCKRV
jgi:hypothetical protein